MPYHGHTRRFCKVCERERSAGERFSARGKCPECGDERVVRNHRELVAHRGPFFDHWRERCLAAFGVAVVDTRDERR